jgi:hypothetical protein
VPSQESGKLPAIGKPRPGFLRGVLVQGKEIIKL